MDTTELRRLATAADSGNWYSDPEMYRDLRKFGITADYAAADAAFIAAASPATVLALLDEVEKWKQAAELNEGDYQRMYRERNEARDAVRRLVGAADSAAWDALLRDPVVKRIVEGE